MRLIDANAYEHAVQGNPYVSDSMKTYVRCSIQSQPTIDAVSVIRCKDCKWYEFDVSHRCGYTGLNGYIAEDDFCSKAEPKEYTEA